MRLTLPRTLLQAHLEVIALQQDPVGGQEVPILDLADVADDNLADGDLFHLVAA